MRTGQTAQQHRVSGASIHSFDEFRTAVSSSFVPLHVTTDRPDPFWGRIRNTHANDIHVTEIAAAAHLVERTPELISRSDRQFYKLNLQLSGTSMLIQDNREALLRPGDMAVYDTHRPYSLALEDNFRTMVMMFPKHLIELPSEMVGQLTAVKMSGREGIGSVITPFLAQLATGLDHLAGPTSTRLVHNALDIVTTMFASELDLRCESPHPHLALMQQVRQYIDDNLGSTGLGPASIAAAHYISTRHLHGVFHEQGTTVSSWIRMRRLERCHRDLLDPVHKNRPVAAIASRWGFVDAAHFSRVFKAAYGQSPSELRSSGRGE